MGMRQWEWNDAHWCKSSFITISSEGSGEMDGAREGCGVD